MLRAASKSGGGALPISSSRRVPQCARWHAAATAWPCVSMPRQTARTGPAPAVMRRTSQALKLASLLHTNKCSSRSIGATSAAARAARQVSASRALQGIVRCELRRGRGGGKGAAAGLRPGLPVLRTQVADDQFPQRAFQFMAEQAHLGCHRCRP